MGGGGLIGHDDPGCRIVGPGCVVVDLDVLRFENRVGSVGLVGIFLATKPSLKADSDWTVDVVELLVDHGALLVALIIVEQSSQPLRALLNLALGITWSVDTPEVVEVLGYGIPVHQPSPGKNVVDLFPLDLSLARNKILLEGVEHIVSLSYDLVGEVVVAGVGEV